MYNMYDAVMLLSMKGPQTTILSPGSCWQKFNSSSNKASKLIPTQTTLRTLYLQCNEDLYIVANYSGELLWRVYINKAAESEKRERLPTVIFPGRAPAEVDPSFDSARCQTRKQCGPRSRSRGIKWRRNTKHAGILSPRLVQLPKQRVSQLHVHPRDSLFRDRLPTLRALPPRPLGSISQTSIDSSICH